MFDWQKFIADIKVDDVEQKPPSPVDSEMLRRLRTQPPQNYFDVVEFIANLPGYGDGPSEDGKTIYFI